MSSATQRLNVLTLYRAKLRICREMGHVYGRWNHIYVYKTNNLNRKFKSKSIINQKNIGTIMWNNVQHQYRLNSNERDTEFIDQLIDNGFKWLPHMNHVLADHRYTFYAKWGFYEPLKLEAGEF